MKKLEYGYIASGVQQPIIKNTLQHIQEAFQEPIDALGKMLSGQFSGVSILYGCVNSTPAGPAYTISAGAVFYNGEVYLVDAATFTPGGGQTAVGTITTTYIASDPVLFTDGSTHDVHAIRKIVLAAGASGSGTADYDNWRAYGAWKTLEITSGMLSPTGTTISSVTLGYIRYTRVGNILKVRMYLNIVTAAATLQALTVQLSSIMAAVNSGAFNAIALGLTDASDASHMAMTVSNNTTVLNLLPIGGPNFSSSTNCILRGSMDIEI